MAKLTPEQFQEKHARNLKAANADMERGVQNVTEAPTLKAAAAQEKMLAGITRAVTSGKWADGLKRVSLDEWKDKMITKGIPRVAAGIDAAAPKVIAFAAALLPFEDELKAKIDRMPNVTIDDSINRATTWMRGMAKFRR